MASWLWANPDKCFFFFRFLSQDQHLFNCWKANRGLKLSRYLWTPENNHLHCYSLSYIYTARFFFLLSMYNFRVISHTIINLSGTNPSPHSRVNFFFPWAKNFQLSDHTCTRMSKARGDKWITALSVDTGKSSSGDRAINIGSASCWCCGGNSCVHSSQRTVRGYNT